MGLINDISDGWTGGKDGRRDPERAIALATDVFEDLLHEKRIPVLEEMRRASEPLLDGVPWGPNLVVGAYETAEPFFRRQELRPGATDAAGLDIRHGPSVEMARALYRDEREVEALLRAFAVMGQLEELVGGRDRLVTLLSSPGPNAVAGTAIAALGILLPCLRGALPHLKARPRAHLPMIAKRYMTAYLSGPEGPVLYPRTHAVASQGMAFLIYRADPRDANLIKALYELDERTRPHHARGRATAGLRELALARYLNRRQDIERYEFQAKQSLKAFGLHRHLQLHEARGDLAA